jgi:hypothetical protein
MAGYRENIIFTVLEKPGLHFLALISMIIPTEALSVIAAI